MEKTQYSENLFKELTRKDGSSFSDETVENWYRARHFILNLKTPLDIKCTFDKKTKKYGNGITTSSGDRVHAIVCGTSDIMLAAVRQIALIAHYPNFNENTGANRTLITILCKNTSTQEDFEKIIDRLSAEEYLYNLPLLCKYSFRKNAESAPFYIKNEDSFIDIEIELVGCSDYSEYAVTNSDTAICEADIRDACHNIPKEQLETIDTSKARLVKTAYEIGCELDNLPADDPNTAKRYGIALNVFRYHIKKDKENGGWKKDSVTNKLSNVFCADCFESRLRSTGKYAVHTAKTSAEMLKAVEDNLWALARCEHNRWNVEKLILGFRPLSPKEVFEDNTLFGSDKKAFRKRLKNRSQDPAHIDLCSYRDLRRIDPGSMKYDCFLILSIPQIQFQTF